MGMLRKILRMILLPVPGKWFYLIGLEIESKVIDHKRSLFKQCGTDVFLANNAFIMAPSQVCVGNHCMINEFVHILGGGGVEIGDGVWIANHASIISSTHPTDVEYIGDHPQVDKSVKIEGNVWIGSHAVILPGVKLGHSCIVGAGSVVTKDVPPYAIVAGIPAQVKRYKNLHNASPGLNDAK